MKHTKFTFFLAGITMLLFLTSCAKVYHSPDALRLCRDHRIIAVASPKVTIPPQKKLTPQEVSDLAAKESESFQYEMVSWLLKRQRDGKINVDVLDASTTIATLTNASDGSKMMTPLNMAETLDVDAVLLSTYKLTKPMSTGAAIVTSVLFGFGTTNQVVVNMELYDRKSQKMIWNFSHALSGGLFSTSEQLVNEVMRIASKKLPYSKLKK